MKKSSRNIFIFLVPLLLVLGFGVFSITAKRSVPSLACSAKDLSGMIDLTQKVAKFEGKEVGVPDLALREKANFVLGINDSDKWIEVDLSEQKLKAWEGGGLFLETAVSSGLPWYPTPTGEFRIWVKLRATKMEGGSGKYYYYLPNVPYVMYFEGSGVPRWKGYGLHGTYWHNDFGRQRSHGCVNLPTTIAEKLYYWVTPVLPDGKASTFADEGNVGTRIVIHD